MGVDPSRVRQLLAERRLLAARDGGEWRILDLQFSADGLVPNIGRVVAALPGGSIATAVAGAFGARRVIERSRDGPYLAAFRLTRPIRLLDLASEWPTRAGASQAIDSGRKDTARAWARAIFEEYDIDGLWYPSSMGGTAHRGGDPPQHGHAVVLFGTGRSALPAHPALNLALDHPAIGAAIAGIAERFGYGLMP